MVTGGTDEVCRPVATGFKSSSLQCLNLTRERERERERCTRASSCCVPPVTSQSSGDVLLHSFQCCFTSTETVWGGEGRGTQDVQLDFHTVPELRH